MNQRSTETDTESLQHSGRRRWSRLDACLVMSIIVLFVAVTAVAVVVALIVMNTTQIKMSARRGESPNQGYKMQNFVYLAASSRDLKTSTMTWSKISYLGGTSVGSNFNFDENQNSLLPLHVGSYFIYVDLNLTCTYKCMAGRLSVQVGDMLTCSVQLPNTTNSTPVTKKCWTVSQAGGKKMLSQMTVPEEGLENWKLETSGSGLGMFLVDP